MNTRSKSRKLFYEKMFLGHKVGEPVFAPNKIASRASTVGHDFKIPIKGKSFYNFFEAFLRSILDSPQPKRNTHISLK